MRVHAAQLGVVPTASINLYSHQAYVDAAAATHHQARAGASLFDAQLTPPHKTVMCQKGNFAISINQPGCVREQHPSLVHEQVHQVLIVYVAVGLHLKSVYQAGYFIRLQHVLAVFHLHMGTNGGSVGSNMLSLWMLTWCRRATCTCAHGVHCSSCFACCCC